MMRKLYSFLALFLYSAFFSQAVSNKSFHDTQGNIEVNGSGQLQFTLPIALPPGVKSVAPQVNLVYTSGSGNGIVGYGWNLSGITAISRVGKNIDKDGKVEGIQLNYEDYYSFNGQRLILKSGEYGKDGAEYTTEKFSNVKIKSVGSLSGKNWKGPESWEVTFEDGSQAWYGTSLESKNPIEYNITKWKDAQGNYITYQYTQQNNVAVISRIKWGGNETLNKPHFNEMIFNYSERNLKESSYVAGEKFIQNNILNYVQVNTNGKQFKKYIINYNNGANGTKYQFVENITEYNSNNEPANPITFEYEKSVNSEWKKSNYSDNDDKKLVGDFDGDGKLDFIKYLNKHEKCIDYLRIEGRRECMESIEYPSGLYLYRSTMDDVKEERIYINVIGFSKQDFEKRSVVISLRDAQGVVKSGQGFAIYKNKESYRDDENNIMKYDIDVEVYSLHQNFSTGTYTLVKEYTKTIPADAYDRSYGKDSPYIDDMSYIGNGMPSMYNAGYRRSNVEGVRGMDIDGDGISELVLNVSDMQCYFEPENENDYNGERRLDVTSFIGRFISYRRDCHSSYRNTIIDMNYLSSNLTYAYHLDMSSRKYPLDQYKQGDFNGDGKVDFLKFYNNQPYIVEIQKNNNRNTYEISEKSFYQNEEKLEGLVSDAFVGDFNGDGKADLLIPVAKDSFNWNLYLSNGKRFIGQDLSNFSFYRPKYKLHEHRGRGYYFGRHYYIQDLNQDGKSDFIEIGTFSKYLRDQDNNDASFIVRFFENTGIDGNGNISFIEKNIDGHQRRQYLSNDYEEYPYNLYNSANGISTPHKFGILSPLIGNFYVNNSSHQILLMHQEGGLMVKYSSYELSKASRIKSITQGGLRTEVDYKELDPRINPGFYEEIKKEQYPYMEMDKVSGTYAVAQLRQIISENQIRKQDFRYRGFVAHLKGKGMIGFRKTARSSWYADGFENTKVWSGAEIDPHNEGLPIKEWSIKTNNESEIFPADLSLGNKRLLSLKTTNYKIDKLLGRTKVSQPNDSDKPRLVTAIVPTEITTKDFIKDVVSVDRIEYNEFYLPVKTISNTNNGFAEKITTLDYYPANLSGVGKDYSVGRPRSKEELVRAYGDSKGAKEEYHYENNLLKTLKTYNRDNSGYLQETYSYDGFGNIVQKVISNSLDSNTQTTSSRYEDKGRFVVEKTDNLGLITRITYNDLGQVLTQTDPLGNTLTNTYDAWGKQLTTTTNLGGTTRFAYEKLSNNDVKTTEFSPDGGETIIYTNKIGQNYKTTTKAFKGGVNKNKTSSIPDLIDIPIYWSGPVIRPDTPKVELMPVSDIDSNINIQPFNTQSQNKYVSKEVVYDALGRKIKESEPYFEGEGASKWNTIEYDEYSRPIKATSYTGKVVDTKYTSNSVTVTETNANGRFKKQVFDALGNITSTEDKGGVIYFKYNAAGENIESKYDKNIVTTKYDVWGRKIEFHDPSNGIYRYEYNHGFGLPTKTISPKGEKTYAYNDKGQLISQREVSKDGKATDKQITFTYNDKGMLTAKRGTSKGKSFSSSIEYDRFGRVISAQEQSYGRTFAKKNIVYDNLNRVVSYEKSLISSGKETKAVIEQIYDDWSGELYQLKDKTTGKILWELKGHNAKGQVTSARLGGSEIRNTYDRNGFLSNIHHQGKDSSTILNISYSFNAIKNELNSRTTGGDFNILESFVYDDNNRLVNWTNPVTGKMHHNVYDKQGRIVENDQLGKIKFENTKKVYQPTGATLNSEGEKNIKNNLIQHIGYNENNDPIFIDGVKGDVRFEYGLTAMRQMVSFGGDIADQERGQGKYTRYYSEDGSYEVTVDNQTGKEKHILYIGGNPYESDIIYLKDYNEQEAKYKFLHKDYLGSILAISDEEGNKIEQRHYDAWGNLTHLQIGKGEILTGDKLQKATSQMLIDRGYTSHEHFFEVGVIHMNGRLYDPLLRRFLNADEFIQDPHNTQNYNKYGYVFNNPLMFSDPSGEIVPLLIAAGIGAIVGVATYTISLAITGNLHQWNIGGALKSAFWGAVSGAVTFGVGEIFSSAWKAGLTIAESLKNSIGGLGLAMVRGGTHAIAQGILGVVQGDNFFSSAISAFAGSLGADAWGGLMKGVGLSKFAESTIGTVTFGALSGGIGAELSGGNFWQGAVIGGIVAGLNHAMHKMDSPFADDGDPPYKYNGKTYESKGELYGAILVDQAAEQFGIKDIVSLAAALDNQGLLSKPFQMEGASKGTSLASKYGSKLMPWEMSKRLPTHMRNGTLRYTKVFGRFLGRMAGPIGWGILAYDVGMTLYNTQTIYNGIINGK